ncbi:MAG: SRPBCC family protein [Cyclobacteriaceae bacterium]
MGDRVVTFHVSVKEVINTPAAPAWEILSGFRGIEEFSPISKSQVSGEGVGAIRTCRMPDGAEIKEVLTKVDHGSMKMTYEMVNSSLPIEQYKVQLQVMAKGSDHCEIQYNSSCQINQTLEEDMMKLLQSVYTEIILGLERYLRVV